MHDAFVAGMKLNGGDEFVLGRGDGDDEVLQDVRAVGWHGEWLGHLHHEVGFSKQPALGEPRRRWQIRGVPLRRSGLRPRAEKREFAFREPAFADESLVPARRNPRRHLAICDHAGELLRTLRGLRKIGERKRRGLSLAVAIHAAGENHRRDVPSEDWTLLCGLGFFK
jgi:hypothetical protein